MELIEDYLKGALGRFEREPGASAKPATKVDGEENYYRVPRLASSGTERTVIPLATDGGATRRLNESPKVLPTVAAKKAQRRRTASRKEA